MLQTEIVNAAFTHRKEKSTPPSLEQVLIFVDEPCVIDGNLVSGRTYRDSGRFLGSWISLLDQPLDQPPRSACWRRRQVARPRGRLSNTANGRELNAAML